MGSKPSDLGKSTRMTRMVEVSERVDKTISPSHCTQPRCAQRGNGARATAVAAGSFHYDRVVHIDSLRPPHYRFSQVLIELCPEEGQQSGPSFKRLAAELAVSSRIGPSR